MDQLRQHTPGRSTFSRSQHPKWREYSSLRFRIDGLPEEVTTLAIHKAMKPFGYVVWIDIFESKKVLGTYSACVEFRPPPRVDFWSDRRGLVFNFGDGSRKRCLVYLSTRQPEEASIRSPVRPDVFYPEEIVLNLDSIDFGVLSAPNAMTILTTKRGQDGVHPQMIVNLRRKEIEIRFPSYLDSTNGGAVRTYRLLVALDNKFDIFNIDAEQFLSFIIHLRTPPWYSRKLIQQISQSHSADAWKWKENDVWTRQTDIVDHKETYDIIDRTPIEIRKNLNSINISRWTTFRLTVLSNQRDNRATHSLRDALRDFNVEFQPVQNFALIRSTNLEAPFWSSLNESPVGTDTLEGLWSESHEAKNLDLPFAVRYQLEVCISKGWLNEYNLNGEFLQELRKAGDSAQQMLIYVDSFQERVFDPFKIFTDIRYRKPIKARKLPEHCVEIQHATVTATSVLFHTPTVENTNRIIRKYKQHADRFLRVRFEDDEYRGKTRLFSSTNNKMDLLFRRVKRVLRHGIRCSDRHYEFLAWGNSQLREHGVYFFAGIKGGVNASKIRAEMGAFDNEKVVAKRAARMGQCFSTTKPIVLRLPTITRENTIPDIMRGKYNFTDGVGKISDIAARIAQSQLKISGNLPSVYQFRLGGCKGVLTLSPDLTGIDIKIRESQFKFNSLSGELEIIRWSEFWQACTNRQLILVLSHLGVPKHVFLHKQQEVIEKVNKSMDNELIALKALRDTVDPNRMTLSIAEMIEAGFMKKKEPFLTSLLHLWRAWTLKYLKEKAKIPIAQGAFVLGCVDELGILQGHFESRKPSPDATKEEMESILPEIFIQITDPQTGQQRIIEGICMIARNPSLHPGDIRVVKAVNHTALHHLCDVLVMPQTGDRDLPSMCSGGDLDGDDYIVIWDRDLIPRIWNEEPFHYDAPYPKTAEGEITTEHIIDFFHDYLKNDFLGRIATAHLARADNNGDYDHGLESNICLELVQLHSLAVDYPKTGVPAILQRGQEPTAFPHFMEKNPSYRSHDVLGVLFDAVKKVEFEPKWTNEFDRRILDSVNVPTDVIEAAEFLKQSYDASLQRIMAQHQIRTEFEVWSTFVLNHSKAGKDFKFHEEIGQLSKNLKDQYYEALAELAGGNDFQHLAPYAVAAYTITKRQIDYALEGVREHTRELSPEGMPFISFPWLLQDILIKVASVALAAPDVKSTDQMKELSKGNDATPLDSITTLSTSNEHSTDLSTPTEFVATPITSSGSEDVKPEEPLIDLCSDWSAPLNASATSPLALHSDTVLQPTPRKRPGSGEASSHETHQNGESTKPVPHCGPPEVPNNPDITSEMSDTTQPIQTDLLEDNLVNPPPAVQPGSNSTLDSLLDREQLPSNHIDSERPLRAADTKFELPLSVGMSKDPALMTEEEKKASGYYDALL